MPTKHMNFADLFETVADAIPDREALVVNGGRRLTFAELDARANRAAHAFTARGIGPGDHIGLYVTNGTEYLEAMLGAYKIRAVPVNVNYRYVEEELRYLFNDADLKLVVANREYVERIKAVKDACPMLHSVMVVDDRISDAGEAAPDNDEFGEDGETAQGFDDYETLLAAQSAQRDFAERSPDDIYILYTGGTTGMPKGVLWRQEDAFYACLRGGNPIGAPAESNEALVDIIKMKGVGMRYFVVPPLMHGAAQWATYMAWYGGDTVLLDELRTFDADALLRFAADEKANTMVVVGDAMGRPLVDALDADPDAYDLSNLFALGSGGAILSDAVKESLRTHLPNILIMDSFGVSETGFQGGRASTAGTDSGGPRFQMDDTTAVLDEELRPIEPGSDTVGMLARGGRIPLGYHKDAEKSAKTFVTDANGKRWALPGDMARVDADGTIVLLGRGSQCINTGGEKVFPEEVEAALKRHPAIFDATVVGVPDERFGSRVAAVVSLRPGHELTKDEMDRHCREHVAGYKVPRELVIVDTVVRSPSGKPDYRWAKATAEKAVAG